MIGKACRLIEMMLELGLTDDVVAVVQAGLEELKGAAADDRSARARISELIENNNAIRS